MQTKILLIPFKHYSIATEPDCTNLGNQIDSIILSNFSHRNLAIRAIGLVDHPTLTLESLTSIICSIGTDKYDPNRKSVCDQGFENYIFDMHASPCSTNDKSILWDDDNPHCTSFFGEVIYDFYHNAPLDRGYPIRIDLVLLYDRNQLTGPTKLDSSIENKFDKFLFKFKNPENKKASLFGIIQLTRD